MVKIRVITKVNYRNEVMVDDSYAYESFLHRSAEIKNLKHLIKLLDLENVEVVENEEEKQ
jgi:hypothetical protein